MIRTMRRGQVAVYLAMVIVAICILALLVVDTFVVTRAKARTQNGGDAAALAAARRQGLLLNEIGRMNIEHFVAALDGDAAGCSNIVERQRRLLLISPVEALKDASDAAKANGMPARPEFSEIVASHAADVRNIYAGGGGSDGDPYPPPYEGAWEEYADALQSAASSGLAAGADNVEYYYAAGGHILLDRSFYDAVAAKDWCWFHFNCESLLSDYSGWQSWPPLPARNENALGNSEFFSLHLKPRECALLGVFTAEELARAASTYGGTAISAEEILRRGPGLLADPAQVWFFYDDLKWRLWFNGYSVAGEDGGRFPVVGTAKPEYNVRGCAAVCRCAADTVSEASGGSSVVEWAAAAKPFGTLRDEDGNSVPANAAHGLVLPCFEAVRLVPLDSVGGRRLATAKWDWVEHLRRHLPPYLLRGVPGLSPGCRYCEQLAVWERPSFRNEGVIWLKHNSRSCVRAMPGGSSGGGGTSHGH